MTRATAPIFLVLLALAGCAGAPVSTNRVLITILHTNDHHGRFWRNRDGEYGLAARRTLIEAIRTEVAAQGGAVLLLDAGDVNTGVPESDLQNAEPDFLGMTLLGYDAMAVGNHEFDKPPQTLAKQRAQWSNFPWLSANVFEGGQPMFEPYRIFTKGGVRIAVMGLTTEETGRLINRRYYQGVEIADPITHARSLVPTLRRQADVIVGLTHMGHYPEPLGADRVGDIALAEAVDGIDVIVGGHSQQAVCMTGGRRNDTYIPGAPCQPDRHNGTWIVQAAEWGKYVGRADFAYADGHLTLLRYRLLPVNLQGGTAVPLAEDTAMLTLLAPFQQAAAASLATPIGRAVGRFDGDRANVRFRPTNLGKLITSVMLEVAHADVAVMSAGGIRDSLPDGEIRWRDILTALPFRNEVVTVRMNGAAVGAYLDLVEEAAPGTGAYAQTSGTTRTGPERKIDGYALDPARVYTVATTRFNADGGDGYPKTQASGTGILVADAVRDYFIRHGVVNSSTFSPASVQPRAK